MIVDCIRKAPDIKKFLKKLYDGFYHNILMYNLSKVLK